MSSEQSIESSDSGASSISPPFEEVRLDVVPSLRPVHSGPGSVAGTNLPLPASDITSLLLVTSPKLLFVISPKLLLVLPPFMSTADVEARRGRQAWVPFGPGVTGKLPTACAIELIEPDRDSLPVVGVEQVDGLLAELMIEPGVEDRREFNLEGRQAGFPVPTTWAV